MENEISDHPIPQAKCTNFDDNYKGIKNFSWLSLFIGYLLIIAPLFHLANIGGFKAADLAFEGKYGTGILSVFPNLRILFYLFAGMEIGLAFFSFYAGIMLQNIRPNAVKVAKTYLISCLACKVILFPLFIFFTWYIAFPNPQYDMAAAHSIGSILKAIIIFTIWYVFLMRSKRVKATYLS